MDGVNKTLYIPLYGKAFVSKKGIILKDEKAEEIWSKEQFELKRKSKSKWLAYYMGMRSTVFDKWVRDILAQNRSKNNPSPIVLHIGCGMDSRVLRVGCEGVTWYDVDFSEVIKERQKYYTETEHYRMLSADARETDWIKRLPITKAVVVLEGMSMYFKTEEMQRLLAALGEHFSEVKILMDCYTQKAAKASKYKNPINDVGVTQVYGIDNPRIFEENTNITHVREHDMTPEYLVNQLAGMERVIFKHLFGGKISKAMYRMYEFEIYV